VGYTSRRAPLWRSASTVSASRLTTDRSLTCRQLGDCHEFRCFKEWYPQSNNITLSKYAFELEEIFSYDRVKEAYPDWQMGIFGHSPDTVSPHPSGQSYGSLGLTD
jgi:hypothetical protein